MLLFMVEVRVYIQKGAFKRTYHEGRQKCKTRIARLCRRRRGKSCSALTVDSKLVLQKWLCWLAGSPPLTQRRDWRRVLALSYVRTGFRLGSWSTQIAPLPGQARPPPSRLTSPPAGLPGRRRPRWRPGSRTGGGVRPQRNRCGPPAFGTTKTVRVGGIGRCVVSLTAMIGRIAGTQQAGALSRA